MRKVFLPLVTAMAMFVLAGCPTQDPYQRARTAISIARTITAMSETGMVAADKAVTTSCNSKICIKVGKPESPEYKACMLKNHGTDPVFVTCYAKMKKAKEIYGKALPVVNSGWNLGDTAVNLAEAIAKAKESGDMKKLEAICLQLDSKKGAVYQACMQGKPVGKADWSAVLKASACMGANILAAIPAEYQKYIAALEAILRGYGCSK